jgi:glutamate carboxypeptidase
MNAKENSGNSVRVPMRGLLAGARKKEPMLLKRLEQLVTTESPSEDKAAVDRCISIVEGWARALDGRTKRHRQHVHGDLLEARFGPRKGKPVLLLGHLDTVWPIGTLKRIPFRLKDGRAWGPGTLDMKAGVAMAFTAVEILAEADLLRSPVILLLTSEEEIGSPVSRPAIEKIASTCESVFVLEPAQGLSGAYKTARKGVGCFRLKVDGVAAHSGVDFSRGHSAILELARLITQVSTFSEEKIGLTVNPGIVAGGTRSNVIAAEAWVEVDVRITRQAHADRIEKKFRRLKVTDRACRLTVEGGLNRPPMERKAGTIRLFRQAATLGGELGVLLKEAATGGGSDGNFTAALNIPTLDGMGAVGEGAHAEHESILLEHLAPRTALLAAMIAGL